LADLTGRLARRKVPRSVLPGDLRHFEIHTQGILSLKMTT